MEMSFKQIVEHLLSCGSICDRYTEKVVDAKTKSALMDIISDTNGITFVTQKISTSVDMDYDEVKKTLASHINGNRIFTHISADDEGEYTSEIYIGYKGEIVARTTTIGLWGCDARVNVPNGKFVEINVDAKTRCTIDCGDAAKVACVYWGEQPSAMGHIRNIRFIQGKEE